MRKNSKKEIKTSTIIVQIGFYEKNITRNNKNYEFDPLIK